MRKMKRLWFVPVIALLIVGGLLVWWWYAFHAGGGPPIFTISKETTYVDGPMLESGHIDYVTALNERLAKGITPENNAQVLIVKALGPRPEGTRMPAEYYKWLGIKRPAEQALWLVSANKWSHNLYFVQLHEYLDDSVNIPPGVKKENRFEWNIKVQKKREAILNKLDQVCKRPWKAADHPYIASWLKANEKPLAVVVEATKRPLYFNPMVPPRSNARPTHLMNTLLPTAQLSRELASGFAARAMLRTGEGRYDEAWQDLLACHRLARVISRGASLIEQLVGVANDTIAGEADVAYLSAANLDAAKIKTQLIELKKIPPLAKVVEKVKLSERFSILQTVMIMDRDGIDSLSVKKNWGSTQQISPLTGKVDWDPALRTINKFFDRLVAACNEKDRIKRNAEFTQIITTLSGMRVMPYSIHGLFVTRHQRGKLIGDVLVALLTPAVHKVKEAEERAEQQQQNLHTAFALAAYRCDHGRYPDKLERLAPAYLESVPHDLFTGKALIYRLTKDGYLLYSVGMNGLDDEGRGADDDLLPGDDLSVRMPLASEPEEAAPERPKGK